MGRWLSTITDAVNPLLRRICRPIESG
jgi:hypothetical protein